MPVKDFMTKKVIYISPDTTVAYATDKMREHGLRRLPVIENDRLVGLVTASSIAKASPSQATSLSIYEMNYLLNKTRVADIMTRQVVTISKEASLEDAIYTMMVKKVGVLPVIDDDRIFGIITDRDIFKAFLVIAGYGEAGIRARLIIDDAVGRFEKVVTVLTKAGLNIKRIVVANHTEQTRRVELQLEGRTDLTLLTQALQEHQVLVEQLEERQAKPLLF